MAQQMVKIDNIPIRDLLVLLNQLVKEYDLVDLLIDPENRKVTINPVSSVESEDPEDLPEEDQELTEDNIYDII